MEKIKFAASFLADSSFTMLKICCLAGLVLLGSWLQPIPPGCRPGGEGSGGCSPGPLQTGRRTPTAQELHPLAAITYTGGKIPLAASVGWLHRLGDLPVIAACMGCADRISHPAPIYGKRHKDLRGARGKDMYNIMLYGPTNDPTCSLLRKIPSDATGQHTATGFAPRGPSSILTMAGPNSQESVRERCSPGGG